MHFLIILIIAVAAVYFLIIEPNMRKNKTTMPQPTPTIPNKNQEKAKNQETGRR
jgi:hypothetical protein